MRRIFANIAILLIVAGAAFVYRDQVRVAAMQMYAKALPCSSPITYRIGTIDPQFGLSQAQFFAAIQRGVAIWEKGSKRTLFAYDQNNGSVVVNLVYDYRQQAIDKLKNVGITIDDTQSSYDQLKAKYDALKGSYEQNKSTLESQIAAFQRDQDAYNAEVQSWNAHGGAPRDVYQQMQVTKADLDARRAQVQTDQNAFNTQVDTINALVTTLNRLVGVLHLQAAKYNAIGQETGGEFEEGVYESVLGAQKIDIYEFGNRAELTRVLAHELGHALGLNHADDKDAIMYRLNQSSNDRMTPSDLTELERVCGAGE